MSEATYELWMTKRGDVLFTTEAPMGNVAVVHLTERLAQRVICLRPYGALDSDFLAVQLLSPPFQLILHKAATGLTAKGIKAAKLKRLPVTVPPLAEQRRAKIDELMALCDRLEAAQAERERRRVLLTKTAHRRIGEPSTAAWSVGASTMLTALTRSAEQVSPLRQTILRLAIQGRLNTSNPSDEPAAAFLGRRALSLERQVEPWPVPDKWTWSSLALLGTSFGGGTPSKANQEFWTGHIPWVSPKDMKLERVFDSEDHISEGAIEHSSAKLIPTGALLLVVRGMILAHSFPTAINGVPVTINQDMKALEPFRNDIADFLLLTTKALKPEVLRLVKRSTHGTCKLLTDELFSLPLPIPPLPEQRRIVARVHELMVLCDRLEAQLTTAQTESARLLEAVLHKALEDASHQPANV